MNLVIDTNVLISVLLKDSVTREILLFPSFEFFLPEYALEEVEAHKGLISKRSGLDEEAIDVILSLLLENITIIPASEIKPNIARADKLIGHIDPFDVPFVALALSVENDGIWSNDKHFENLKGIKVWKTADLFTFIGKEK
ncbi:MAG: putative nucleotide-binding protein, containing domain [Deltaproteobacteria bacterium]|nr:putative nucleotide-binding protein, containing domain [Deltaproteobacteria bacterium]